MRDLIAEAVSVVTVAIDDLATLREEVRDLKDRLKERDQELSDCRNTVCSMTKESNVMTQKHEYLIKLLGNCGSKRLRNETQGHVNVASKETNHYSYRHRVISRLKSTK